MVCFYAGETESTLSADEITRLKNQIKELEAKRKEQLAISELIIQVTTLIKY